MKKIVMMAAAGLALLATSCAVVPTGAGIGALYTGVTEGNSVTANTFGKKVGQSQAINVLGVVATGDAGINTAAKNGGIKKVSHVDVKKMSVLGIFSSYTTIVYGD